VSHWLDLGAARAVYEAPSERTPVFVLIGSPVARSLSPQMQTAAFRAAGLDAVYVACEVPPARVTEAVTTMRLRAAAGQVGGANVTVPLKQTVIAALDAVHPQAQLAGAVNTVVVEREPATQSARLVGHNTDVPGLVAALAEHGVELRGASLFVTGTGGMARAAVTAALQAGARAVRVCGREEQRAWDMLEAITAAWDGPLPRVEAGTLTGASAGLAGIDVVVQATSLGMHPGDPLVLEFDTAPPGLFVLDAVYDDDLTPLLRAAQARGLRTCDGRALLLHQGAAAFTLWTGRAAPLVAMRQAIGL
jgi:shikimate dehydrogenase